MMVRVQALVSTFSSLQSCLETRGIAAEGETFQTRCTGDVQMYRLSWASPALPLLDLVVWSHTETARCNVDSGPEQR